MQQAAVTILCLLLSKPSCVQRAQQAAAAEPELLPSLCVILEHPGGAGCRRCLSGLLTAHSWAHVAERSQLVSNSYCVRHWLQYFTLTGCLGTACMWRACGAHTRTHTTSPRPAVDVLRAKGLVAVALLCHGRPAALDELCVAGVLQRVEKCGREQSAYVSDAMAALRHKVAALVPALLGQVRRDAGK